MPPAIGGRTARRSKRRERRRAGAAARLPERACYERAAAQARAVLGPEAFAVAWKARRDRSLDEAVAEAQAVLAPPGVAETEVRPTAAPAQVAAPADLTPRGLEILRLSAAGAADRQIAEARFVSRRTVATHVASILKMLGVKTRTAATVCAVRECLV
jgi:DNA-binding NarL/FixJ family response regulator